MKNRSSLNEKLDNFEQTTRQIRWATLAVILATFPWHSPQAVYVYSVVALVAVYNAILYLPFLQRATALRSPVMTLILDGLFVGVFLALIGNPSTPYSALLVFMVIIAAYLHRMVGVIVVCALEAVVLFIVTTYPLFPSITLDTPQIIAITIYALLAFGFLVARLTHADKVERDTLRHLRQTSDQERLRLMTLVNSLNSAIFVTDSKGKVIQHNEAARVLANIQDNHHHHLSKLLPLFRRADPKATLVNILSDNSSVQHRRDLSIMSTDDRKIDLEINVTPVQVQGKATEYIIVCEDISQERTLEEERTEFISVASHELRTPLAIIEAALESALVVDKSMSEQGKVLLDQAHRNTLQLAQIVKDLSILAEAQNDNIPVDLVQIDPTHILEECAIDFAPQAEGKGMTLKHYVEPATPTVLSTEHHIREILQNFLTNALKYSQEGTITLRAEPAKNGGILFSVQDQGIGLSPSDQKMLFTKFFRAESYLTRVTGGTGLGLYLCMELAERMGAKLWCKSDLGKGSTFYLEVPPQSELKRDQGKVVEAQVANLIEDL